MRIHYKTHTLVIIEDNIKNITDTAAKIVSDAAKQPDKGGRPPTARRRRQITRQLRTGQAQTVDKAWLLEQLLLVYSTRDCRPNDKIRALELMAKISGYDAKESSDEQKALADLIHDMEQPESNVESTE